MIASPTLAGGVTAASVPQNIHIYSTSGTLYFDHVAKGCSGYRYYLSTSHPSFDPIVSILLAAQLAERKVVIRFGSCNSNNQGSVIGVYLK